VASPSLLLPNLIADTTRFQPKSSSADISVAELLSIQNAFVTAATITTNVSQDMSCNAISIASVASLHSVTINDALPVNDMSVRALDTETAVAAARFSPNPQDNRPSSQKDEGLFFNDKPI
jgi:hypothetical protein